MGMAAVIHKKGAPDNFVWEEFKVGSPERDLLPHEVVGCAFLVDYRRHSHDAFFLLLSIVATFRTEGSQMLSTITISNSLAPSFLRCGAASRYSADSWQAIAFSPWHPWHCCCEVRNCLGRTVRHVPNCF